MAITHTAPGVYRYLKGGWGNEIGCSHSNRNFSKVIRSHTRADEKQVTETKTYKGGMKSNSSSSYKIMHNNC